MFEGVSAERRKNIRVDFKTRIVLQAGESEIQLQGNSRNLSLNGVFIQAAPPLPINSDCTVKIFLSGTTEPTAIEAKGAIVRHGNDGFAITFTELDIDSYALLKNIVRYNVTLPEEMTD